MSIKHPIIIVGTGPAGLTAAIYAARAGFNPLVFAGLQHGGQLTTTTEVENFPGFAQGIHGPKLMEEMTLQAQRVGAEVLYENVLSVTQENHLFFVHTDSKVSHQTKSLIIATGATAKLLGLKQETELMGRGLSTCATCDGFFYKNKKVAVIGGGDSAMEEALYLANLCEKVYLVHRSPNFRASKIMLDRARSHPKIEFKTPYTIDALLHDQTGLIGATLINTENKTQERLEVPGLFYGIGHSPNSKVFLPFVEVDAHGYIKVHEFTKTKTPGIFAAGDVADPIFKQAITSAGMGCQAAMQAVKYLESTH